MKLILALSVLVALCVATSDLDPSLVYNCDAVADIWGCDSRFWINGNRLACANSSSRIMSWATKPIRTDCYRVVAGDEASPSSMYTPNEYINIHIRATCLDKLYRGILLYAVDANDNKVGDWLLPRQDPPLFKLPWSDPLNGCYRSVGHATAENKPYHAVLYFKAPPAGTGPISFRCLIKHGDANTGDFYWPNLNGDLVLNEGIARPPSTIQWIRSDVEQSCTAACSENSLVCNENSLQALNYDTLRLQVAPRLGCEVPHISGCGNLGGSFDPSLGVCYYVDNNCTNEGRDAVSVTCGTVVTGMARNCPCMMSTSGSASSSSSGSVSGAVTGSSASSWSEESPASSRSPSFITAIFSLFFLCYAHPRLALVLMLVLGMTSGHNWINSLSRSPSASTYRPCKPPLTDMPHAQVGPGQSFEIEWMDGHGGNTYFVIVHSRNVDKLKLHTSTMLDDYINLAPNGSNMAFLPLRQRYHRRDSNSTDGSYTSDANVPVTRPNYFTEIIRNNDPRFIVRPAVFGGRIGSNTNPSNGNHFQLAYNLTELSQDRIVSYNSTKYPWIEAVYRFRINGHWPSRADVARFYIPGYGGLGRYVVQYLWRGYYDCIDVDYKADPVANIYGISGNSTLWMRIDHCIFPGVRNVFRNAEIVSDPSFCTNGCGGDCYGVNVVPLQAPLSAFQDFEPKPNTTWRFPDVYGTDIYVPWNHGNFNATRDLYMAASNLDKRYMCYSVHPRQFSDTVDEYKVTNDPQDPIFYSTCYYRYPGNIFPEYLENMTSDGGNQPWRYFSRCLDCDSHSTNAGSPGFPKWKIADKCVNCNAEPSTPAPITPIMIENATRCDGFGNPVWRFANHTTCPNTTSCVKQLVPIGRTTSTSISLSECQTLASLDTDCSNHYFRRLQTGTQFRCYCYKKDSCCLNCSRTVDANSQMFELQARPDPTCATGVRSADNLSCCDGSCGAGGCTAVTANRANVGFCCSSCIPDSRPCSLYGPPCKLI